MKARPVLAVGSVLLGGAIAFVMTAEPIPEVRAPAPVVFVCRNGVAKSVWSAAYFNRLAAARHLRERAIARASIPSFTEVPLRMAFALAIDGFRLDGYRPRVISADDIRGAELVVAIDTELPPDAHPSVSETEVWQGFPPMREQYYPSRKALKARVQALVERLAGSDPTRASAAAGRRVRARAE
jgi:protein-tyrosine-phosphatase